MLLFIITSILFFGILAFIAQRKAPEEYNQKINTINELGCQFYEHRAIMQWGFKGFGLILIAGILFNPNQSLKELYFSIPLMLYALFMFLSGVFSVKPFEHLVFYSIKESKKHTFFTQVAGFSVFLLIVMKLVMVTGAVNRIINISVLVLSLYTSIQSGRDIEKRGLYQRSLYMVNFFWLIYAYSGIMS